MLLRRAFSRRALSSLSLSDARRSKQRNAWPQARVEQSDEDFQVFPNEHLGNQYNLNWAIANYNITASHKAFRNLHARGLIMYADNLDENRAVVVDVQSKDVGTVFSVGEGLSDKQFGSIVRSIREHLSDVPALFLHDGAVGLVQGSGPLVRSFSDSASSALLLHNMLRTLPLPLEENEEPEVTEWMSSLPQELREDPERVSEMVRLGQLTAPPPRDVHDVTQFLITKWQPDAEQKSALGGASSFSIVDPKRRIVAHVGTAVNGRAVRDGLIALKLAGSSSLVLPGAVVLDAGSQKSVVVIGKTVATGDSNSSVFAQHHSIWTEQDVITPAWLSGQVPLKGATQSADYVEQAGAKSKSVIRRTRGPRDAFETGVPGAVVFVSGTKQTKVNPEQTKVLAQGAGLSTEQTEQLVARLLRNKIPVLSVPDAPLTATWAQGILKNQ